MKKIVLLFLILTLVVAGIIFYFNRVERAPRAATLLPESTLLLLSAPDFPTARATFESSPLAALLEEPDVQAALEQPRAALQHFLTGKSDPNQNHSSGPLEAILGLAQGETFLAVTRIHTVPKPKLGLVLGCDTKNRKPIAQGYFKIYQTQIRRYDPNAVIESKTYLGVTYHAWQYGTTRLYHAFFGPLLVIALDEDDLRTLITHHTGHADPNRLTLAQSPRYHLALQQLPSTSTAQLFLNVEQLVTNFGMLLLMAAQTSPAIQNLLNLQAVAIAYQADPKGFTETSVVTYKNDRPTTAPLAFHTLAAAPADTAYYAPQAGNPAQTFNLLMDSLAKSGNPQALQFGANLDKFLAAAGIRLQDDLLAHLGPEIAWLANWRTGAPYPDIAFVAEINNRPALEARLPQITDAIGRAAGNADQIQHAGHTLHIIRTDTTAISPTYTIAGNLFILTLNPDYARELTAPTTQLATAATYQAAFRDLPANPVSLTYLDTAKLLTGLYRLARQNAGNSPLPLPAPETLARHLGPLASVTTVTPRATLTTTRSAISKPATIGLGLIGLIAAAEPWLGQLPPGLIPNLPTTSSNTATPSARAGNPTARSQTPVP